MCRTGPCRIDSTITCTNCCQLCCMSVMYVFTVWLLDHTRFKLFTRFFQSTLTHKLVGGLYIFKARFNQPIFFLENVCTNTGIRQLFFYSFGLWTFPFESTLESDVFVILFFISVVTCHNCLANIMLYSSYNYRSSHFNSICTVYIISFALIYI